MPDTRTDIDPIGELLRPELAKRLDPHLGRAAEAFSAHLRQSGASTPASHRFILWWAPALGALAACVAIGLVLRHWYDGPRDIVDRQPIPKVEEASIEVHRTISWQNFDEGTFMVDEHTPVRRVRREVLETSKWYD